MISPAISQAIREGYARLGIPRDIIDPGAAPYAQFRGIVALYPELCPPDLKLGTLGKEISVADWCPTPLYCRHPFAAAVASLTRATRRDIATLPSDATEQRAWLTRPDFQPNANVQHVRDVIQQIVRLGKQNGLRDGVELRRAALLAHFRCWRHMAKAPCGKSSRTEERFRTAYNHLKKRRRIPSSLFTLKIRPHAPRSVLSQIAARCRKRSAAFRHAIRIAEIDIGEPEIALLAETDLDAGSHPLDVPSNTRRPSSRGYAFDARHLVSGCPCPGDTSEAQLVSIIERAKIDLSPPSAIVRLCAGALIGIETLLDAAAQSHGAHLRIPVHALHRPPSSRLAPHYRRSSDHLDVYPPDGLLKTVRATLRELRRQGVLESVAAWLESAFPETTIPKFEHALLFRGPVWFGYPWALASAGIEGWRAKRPAPCSYTLLTPSMFEQARPYANWVLGNFPWSISEDRTGPGSHWVPTAEAVRKIVRRLDALAEKGAISDDPFVDAFVMAAACHLTLLLFSGIRNHPLPSLPSTLLDAAQRSLLIEQKGMVTLLDINAACARRLRPLREHWSTAAENLDPISGPAVVASQLFAYPQPTRQHAHDWLPPSPKWLAVGMLSDADLGASADIAAASWRHWGNTELRTRQHSESEIREFFGHRLDRFAPWSPHQYYRTWLIRDAVAETLLQIADES